MRQSLLLLITFIAYSKASDLRLPNNTIPLRYDIDLTTQLHLEDDDPEKFKFVGKETIHIQVLETSRSITIHAKQIRILISRIFNEQGVEIPFLNERQPEFDPVREFLTFNVKDYLYKGQVIILQIDYSGFLREDLGGFYRTSFTENGKTHWIAASQFAPNDARHAFPCYDEPQIRAVFGLTVHAFNSYEVVSNMPVKSLRNEEDGMIATSFMDTPSMHTFIFAFMISELSYIGAGSSLDVSTRFYGSQSAIYSRQGEFALLTGMKVMRLQQSYFNTTYDLPKIDQVAMPELAFGGMENWGMIVYQQEKILYDEKSPSVMFQQRIANLVAHEYSHQFFGNLVVPNWFHYAWLNEGFATFYAAILSEEILPEHGHFDLLLARVVQKALKTDAEESNQAVVSWVEDATGVFSYPASRNAIYEKGASILRMLYLSLSASTMQKGVTYYLQSTKYKSADNDDLSRALERAAREDLAIPQDLYMKDVIDSWTLNEGYPVVTVTLDSQNRLRLTQKRYKLYNDEPTDQLWYLPITIAMEYNLDFNSRPLLWSNRQETVISQNDYYKWTVDDWILVNNNAAGFYRVNYEDRLWIKLSEKLNSETFEDIPAANRAQILDDSLNFAKKGTLSYYIALQVAEYLKKEKDFIPIHTMDQELGFVYKLLRGSNIDNQFQNFLLTMISTLYNEVETEDQGMDELHSVKLNRNVAVYWACLLGNSDCIEEFEKKLGEIIVSVTEPPRDLLFSTYCNGLRRASPENFITIWSQMQTETNKNLRQEKLDALGCAEELSNQQVYLETTINPNREEVNYTQSERSDVIKAILKHGGSNAVEVVLEFLVEKFEMVQNVLGNSSMESLFGSIAGHINSPNQLESFSQLLEKSEQIEGINSEDKVDLLKTANWGVDWLARSEDEIGQFLRDFFSRNA